MLSLRDFLSERIPMSLPKGDDLTREQEAEYAKLSPLYKVFKYEGWEFQSIDHSAARAYTRRQDMDIDDWKRMHRTVGAWIKLNKPPSGDILFFSKSADQAYIVALNTKRRVIKIVTVLPKGKSFPKPGTEKVIVEGIEINPLNIVYID